MVWLGMADEDGHSYEHKQLENRRFKKLFTGTLKTDSDGDLAGAFPGRPSRYGSS